MPFITAETAAALAGSVVRMATLVEMQFASRTMRVWNGAGRVRIAGETWDGLGALGSIDGLKQTRSAVSDRVTLKLSGISQEILASARANVADVEGRPCFIWGQLFDAGWQPVGGRLPLFWGSMQRIWIERTESRDTSGGTRIASLEVENAFAARSRPANGRWTDADQQARYPGDTFFRYVPVQQQKTVVWPVY